MKQKQRKRIVSIVAALFAAASAGSLAIWAVEPDADTESINVETLPWPSDIRPRMLGKYIEIQEDGPAEKRLRIDSGSKRFIFEDEGRWSYSQTRTPRYSIILKDRKMADMTFGIARFGPEEFLQSLEDKDWNRYVQSIKSDVVPKQVTYEHYTGEGREAPYVLKNWTRKVEYEYALGQGKTGKRFKCRTMHTD